MYKNTTFKEKFAILNPWMPLIIETIKKDLKNEHLRKDSVFLKTYFPAKNPAKLTTDELVRAYSHAVANADNGENLGEFLTNRWLLKNGEIYHFFEQELNSLYPNFTEVEEIETAQANTLMCNAVEKFGAPSTYLFAVLNSVVFPNEVYQTLGEKAQSYITEKRENEALQQEKEAAENTQRSHEREIARLTDKYEKKLAGLQKMYLQDVDMFKKQIANLQRKLEGK